MPELRSGEKDKGNPARVAGVASTGARRDTRKGRVEGTSTSSAKSSTKPPPGNRQGRETKEVQRARQNEKALQALKARQSGADTSEEPSRDGDHLKAANALMTRLQARVRRSPQRATRTRLTLRSRLAATIGIPALAGSVSDKDLMIFTRQFATMINSGLPLIQSLAIQCLQAPNPFFRQQLAVIKARVQAGATLAGAMRRFPRTFDPLYINLVAAGEMGGVLDEVLLRLAVHIEKAAKLKRQIKAAMVYPSAVIVVAVTVVILLLLKVVPVFERMFQGVGTEIPGPTQLIIDISNFIKTNFLLIGLVVAGMVVAFTSIYKTRIGRRAIDGFLLLIPIVGDILVQIEVARFARTLTTMLTSGVSIIDSLEVCVRATGNVRIRRTLAKARRGVTEGKMLGKQLLNSKTIPPLVCHMISVGEATGALDTMLSKLADFYENEVESSVGTLVSLIEPALMVFLGLVVGGLLIAMYMPIFIMSSAIGHV